MALQPDGERRQPGSRGDCQEQRPPLLAGERLGVLGPAERREPRERAVAHVADGTQNVRDAEGGARHPIGQPVVVRHLSRDQRGSAEEHADRGVTQAEGDRAGNRQAEADQRERADGTDGCAHPTDDDAGRGDGGVATHRQRPQQLQPTGLLLGPGEPPGHQHRQQGHDHQARRTDLEGHLPAQRVQREARPLEGEDRRVGRSGRSLVQVRLGREQAADALGRDGHHQGDAGDPHRDAHPLPSQRRPHQGQRAGHCRPPAISSS